MTRGRGLMHVALASVAACAVGCASAPIEPEAPSADALPASGVVSAKDLAPASVGTQRWRSLEGLLEGTTFDVIGGPSAVAGAEVATRTADQETTHWSRAADGALRLVAADSHPDQARTWFDPPLVLAPRELAPGAEARSESAMRVVAITDERQRKEHGTATRIVRFVRDEMVRWQGQALRAHVVEVEFRADLSAAKVEHLSTLWILPSIGIVAEDWRERMRILSVFDQRSNQRAVREGLELPRAVAP